MLSRNAVSLRTPRTTFRQRPAKPVHIAGRPMKALSEFIGPTIALEQHGSETPCERGERVIISSGGFLSPEGQPLLTQSTLTQPSACPLMP